MTRVAPSSMLIIDNMPTKMIIHKIDPLIQSITVNATVLGTTMLVNVNEILQFVLYLSALGFAALKWRDRYVEKKKNKKIIK